MSFLLSLNGLNLEIVNTNSQSGDIENTLLPLAPVGSSYYLPGGFQVIDNTANTGDWYFLFAGCPWPVYNTDIPNGDFFGGNCVSPAADTTTILNIMLTGIIPLTFTPYIVSTGNTPSAAAVFAGVVPAIGVHTYSTSNAAVFTVNSANGSITPIGAGSADVIFTVTATGTRYSAPVTVVAFAWAPPLNYSDISIGGGAVQYGTDNDQTGASGTWSVNGGGTHVTATAGGLITPILLGGPFSITNVQVVDSARFTWKTVPGNVIP